MPVTVEQILQLPVLKDARLLAGEDGLDRRVASVTVGEVPDIADWLSGGEMVLSTMFAVKGDLDRQREFCRRVMMAGAAALFVKTTRFVESIPADIIELAQKRKFPIIEVPQGLRWTRLMQDATEVIINRQASQLEQSQAVHRSLLGVVIRGGGWQDLVEEASRLLEKPVFVVDVSLELLARPPGCPCPRRRWWSICAARRSGRCSPPSVWRRSCSGWTRKGCPPCWPCPSWPATSVSDICARSPTSPSPPLWRSWCWSTRPPSPRLEMAQDRVRFETEVRLKGDFVDDVIAGGERAGDSLLRRGAFLGCDLSQGSAVLLLGVDEFGGTVTRKNLGEEELEAAIERFFSQVTRYVAAKEPSSLASLKSGQIVVFVCGKTARDPEALRKLATVIQELGRSAGPLSVSAGISGFVTDPGQMDRGYQEALVALKVARKLQGAGALLHFQDVGTYRLLLDIWERDPEQIRSLYEETIGLVDQYDQSNNTQLVQTLAVFFKHDESLTQTAAELYAHRHTIRYRLEKIAEITGLSVFQTEHKERLGLGLKARSLLSS